MNNYRVTLDVQMDSKNPLDGVEYGLGRDKAKAISEARVVNNHIAHVRQQTGLLDRITGADGKALSKWLDEYQTIIGKKGFAAATMRNKYYMVETIRAELGGELATGRAHRRRTEKPAMRLLRRAHRQEVRAAREHAAGCRGGEKTTGFKMALHVGASEA